MKKRNIKVKIVPTNERLIRGDVAVRPSGLYYNIAPTTFDEWYESGILGAGRIAEVRYSAGSILFELGSQTKLMASNTFDYTRVGTGGVDEGPDVAPIDHIRFIMGELSRDSARLFRNMIAAPCMRHPRVDGVTIRLAFDDLVKVIELWKKSDLGQKI